MPCRIDSVISPNSIAVVGASNRPGSVGLAVFKNIVQAGFKGVLYPVNPKARSVQSIKAYPTLADIPDEVDLAIIIVPAKITPEVMAQAGEKGISGAIVISAGFKESGEKGKELENELKSVAAKYGIRMIGPNCLGVINTDNAVSLNASFATKMPRKGNVALISQSGALCTAILDYAEGRNFGFSKFISFGNKADVNEIDLIGFLRDDPDTDVILMYLEDITDGREFLEVAREIVWDSGKPILAIKSGRSMEGARAAASHTGSLAGSDNAYDAIFTQSGILRVEGVNELFNYAIALAKQPIPKGNKIAILTNAGGPGIMATDAAIRHNLTMATLSEDTRAKLRETLPPSASVQNPVDVIGDATSDRYEKALRLIINDPDVDAALVILSPQAMTDILQTAKIIPNVAKNIGKPVLCAFMGIVDVSEGIQYLEENGFPNYTFPESAIRSLEAMVMFSRLMNLKKRQVRTRQVDRKRVMAIVRKKLVKANSYYMGEAEANEILECYGFPTLKSKLVKNFSDVEAGAAEVGFPVAMKIMSPDIVHKFDAGGVKLKIKNVEEARNAYNDIIENAKQHKKEAVIEGVLIERMAKKGIEVILGAVRDPKFGPICMFGLGGTFVEAIKDVTFRLAPMWEISVELMISSIKTYRILQGVRGAPPSDIEGIKDCIIRLSQMLTDHPEISELDINPLIVYPEGQGCVVADSRILLTDIMPEY